MSSDLLDCLLIEVSGVSHQTWDVVCMLQAVEDFLLEAHLRPLLELGSETLSLRVDILHPAMMSLSSAVLGLLTFLNIVIL